MSSLQQGRKIQCIKKQLPIGKNIMEKSQNWREIGQRLEYHKRQIRNSENSKQHAGYYIDGVRDMR